ncbi:hypothetical protein [Streptantibioticus ferralitis]|uniref:Uncharacterized protein n=1 Tax=Streptantibioticus ferralitis TaxID=236510 RepID=A0ABT5YWN3_9ACTN|nr:hypothetical protein [Streptantibioticus ferralitis]MDF2256016.1 hypothetical protein [Streptantibioticus ferralitis]
MRWGTQPRWARWVAVVYIIGFVEGTGSHAYDLFVGGLHAYRGSPLPSQLLFHALLGLDLLAAAWVALTRPAGPILGAAIMVADLTANWWGNWTGILRHPLDYLQPVGLTPMTLFGLFVFATVAPLHRSFRAPWLRSSSADGGRSSRG